MKVGITGAYGFIGWHMRSYLATRHDVVEVRTAGRETFSDEERLLKFVNGLDIIIHLAGINRANPDEIVQGNIEPAKKLVTALEKSSNHPFIAYTSSTQAVNSDSPYAEGKVAVSQIFQRWAKNNNASFMNIIVPHVFGEYGRPYYNSVVSTFSHQIVKGEPLTVNKDGHLELIHVQDLVEQVFKYCEGGEDGDIWIKGRPTSVIEVATLLQQLHTTYIKDGQLPDLSDHFTRSMFNTLRGAMPYTSRQIIATKHEDNRGWLIESVKANSGGQCFVSTTNPGVTRGNHFHRRKVERFMVLQGRAVIKMRKLFNDEIVTYELDGSTPSYVDIPTLHTHSISNVGDRELLTLFWADELFDPKYPDTTNEEVCV